MNELQNNKARLRALEPNDVDLLYEWENNTEIWQVSNTVVPISKYILNKYVENSHLDIYQTGELRLMIDIFDEHTFRTVGCIDLFDFDAYNSRAGIGILIRNNNDRKKHFATLALELLINYSFKILQIHVLYCNIASSNNASLNLFKKAGFQIVGLKKEWRKTLFGYEDEYLLQKINPYHI